MSRRHGLIGASKPYLYKEEDAEFYYRQTSGGVIMNNSSLVGSIDRIKGQTIAWNQLVKTGTSQSPYEHNGLSLTRLSNNTIRIQGTYTGTGTDMQLYPSLPLVKVVSGHKYYISGGSNNFAFSTYNNLPAYQNAPVVRGIYTATGTGNATIYIRCRNLVQNTAYDATFVCNLIDLTLIYGEDNEPSTVAQFEADYFKWFGKPLTYEPYDEGSLRNVQMEGIKSVGFNQWDEEWTVGIIDGNGQYRSSGNRVVAKNFNKVFPNVSYYKSNNAAWVYLYDKEKKYISNSATSPFTTPSNCCFIKFYTIANYGTTYNNDICINISDPNKNGTYGPYEGHNVSIPVTTLTGKLNGEGESVVIFPDGMKGVNDVKDEIYIEDGVTKAVKRVGSRAYQSGDESNSNVITDGTITYYELEESQVFNTDTSLPIAYNCEASGTEEILPEEVGTGIAPIMDIKYKAGNVAEKPWYGIKWSEDNGQMQRIASNMELHATLPIQSKMKRCMLLDNGSVYKYISDADPFLYEDGTSVKYDGTDGQVMVEVPAYWYTAYKETDENNITWNYLKLYPEGGGQRYSRKIYRGAFEMITDNSNNSIAKGCSVSMLDFASMGTTKDTTSFVASNMEYLSAATSYRNWNYANVDATDVKNSLGKPTTNRNRATFRGIAARRGAGFSQEYWDSYNSLIRLYVVEYCNFDIQANINDSLTVEGFKQGGLGAGVTNANSTRWNNFNGYNPFVPCGVTVPLGNKSGVVSYAFTNDDFDDVSINYSVPSYRGIENPFGHIWKFIDGLNRKGKVENDVTTEMIYVCDTISKFAENDVDGYVLQSDTAPRATGSFGGVDWNAEGTFWPKLGGRTMYGDYFYSSYANNTWYTLCGGGRAYYGSNAGLFCLAASQGSGSAGAAIGSRLLYTK